MSYALIRPKRGTKQDWETINPVLHEGELAVEYPASGVGTGICKFKIGDGAKTYNELSYAFDASEANAIDGGNAMAFHLIQLRADTYENWTTLNPDIAPREIVLDLTNNLVKIGTNETKKFNQLPYAHSFGLVDYQVVDTENDEFKSVMDFGELI